MDISQIKLYLLESPARMETLLEYFGFHGFNYAQDSLRCAVPDGDNISSVAIYLNTNLYGVVYTRGSFKSDVFGIIEEFSGRTLSDILRITRALFGLRGSKGFGDRVDIIGDMRKYRKRKRDVVPNTLHDEKKALRGYVMKPHIDIFQEGITFDVLNKYNICYDPERDRILFPHYDWMEHDKVVGIQGRIVGMTGEEANLLGVPKYWNYIDGYQKRMNLYGWNHACKNVTEKKQLILFEAEKSVLKHASYSFSESHAVALGGHELSDQQIRFIARQTPLDCEVVFAFDKDVMTDANEYNKMLILAKRMALFRKTSIVIDRIDNGIIMKPKDSPVDNGHLVWEYLLSEREVVN